MSDRLQVVITGQNGVSRVFQEVTRDATAMGTGVERASQTASQGMTGMGEASARTAAQTETSFEAIGNAIGKTALAFGAFTLVATKIAGDAEASSARLQTAFDNAGLAIDDYQSRIDKLTSTGLHLGFDDEDVQDSLARFVSQTKDVQKSIQDVALAENIARATGESLAAATATVSQIEAGRFRGLASLGIALDATSTKEDYLAALQDKYANSAANYATTGAANFDRWKNTAENALEAVGTKLEGLQLPIIALSTAGSALGPLVGSLKGLAVEGTLLDAALGPVGLAAAALAAGAGIYYLATQTHDYTSAAQTAVGATQDLTNFFLALEQGIDPNKAKELDAFRISINRLVDDATQRQDDLAKITDLETQFETAKASGGEMKLTIDNLADGFAGLTQEQLRFIDTNKDGIVTIDEASAAYTAFQANLDRLDAGQVKAFNQDIQDIFSSTTVDYDKAIAGIAEWGRELQNGTITGAQFIDLLNHAVDDQTVFGRTVGESTTAVQTQTTAVAANSNAIAQQMAVYDSQNKSLSQAIDFTTANTAATVDDTAAREANGRAIAAQMAAYGSANPSLDPAINQASAMAGARSSAMLAQSIKQVGEAISQTNASATAGIPAVTQFGDELASQATSANATAAALSAQSSGYYDLAHSIGQAVTAQESFRNTQDDIIASEGVYGQQLSTYSSQVNEITAAHDLLNQKVADGGTLTQAETDFQNNYNEALERGNGAVDDATISQGLLAEQYLLNMKQGDALNRSMQDQTSAVGTLVDEVQQLINVLLGIPPDTQADVHVTGVSDLPTTNSPS
jgi:hypothetical protein